MPQLIIKWGNRETRFAVTTPSVGIGRSDDNLLQLKDVKISRYHCKIIQTPLGFLLSDSESSNGTFLNGKRVERTLLHNSDVLKVGNVEMVFLESDSVQPENKGSVVISLDNPSDDASVGEVTTVINIQDESVSPVINGIGQNQNGTAQVAVASPRIETAVVAQVAKRVIPNQAPPEQKVMSNQGMQNGSGKPSGIPAPQPARIVTAKPISVSAPKPQSRLGGIPVAQKPVLRVAPLAPKPSVPAPKIMLPPALKPVTPAPRIMLPPAPKASASAQKITPVPAPKTQSGLISRLGKTPKANTSSAGRISGVGVKGSRANRQEVVEEGAAQLKPKKNKNMLYIIGSAALILIVIIAFVASSGSNKKAEEDNKRENESLIAANKLYDEKEYSVALKKYEAFLEEFKDSKYTGEVKERIKKINERDEKEKEARPKLVELKRKKKDYSTSKYPELLKEFDEFIKEYSDVSAAILQEAKGERDTVKRIASSSGEDEVNVSFTKMMGEANKLRDKKNYDGALAKLKSFLKDNPSLNDRQENTIRNEIKAIENEKGEKSEKK